MEHPFIRFVIKYWIITPAVLTFAQFPGVANRFFFSQGGDNAEYYLLARSMVQGEALEESRRNFFAAQKAYPERFSIVHKVEGSSTMLFEYHPRKDGDWP